MQIRFMLKLSNNWGKTEQKKSKNWTQNWAGRFGQACSAFASSRSFSVKNSPFNFFKMLSTPAQICLFSFYSFSAQFLLSLKIMKQIFDKKAIISNSLVTLLKFPRAFRRWNNRWEWTLDMCQQLDIIQQMAHGCPLHSSQPTFEQHTVSISICCFIIVVIYWIYHNEIISPQNLLLLDHILYLFLSSVSLFLLFSTVEKNRKKYCSLEKPEKWNFAPEK